MPFLGGGDPNKKAVDKLFKKQRDAMRYAGVLPGIAGQYANDPRTQAAAELGAIASNTAPTQGGWGEGLLRVASGLGSGFINKANQNDYKIKEAAALRARREGRVDATGKLVADPGADVAASMGIPQQELPPPGQTPGIAPTPVPAPDPGGGVGGAVADAAPAVAAALAPKPVAQPVPQVEPVPITPPTGSGSVGTVNPNGASPVAAALTQGMPPAQPAPVNPTMGSQGPAQPAPALTPSPSPAVNPALIGVPSSRPQQPQQPQRPRPSRPSAGFASYQSKAYDPYEDKYGAQYGVPPTLVRAIRIAGERSNANQVSGKGARSVYQFTPETRQLWIKNKGYDPWAGPENAARAASEHLADDFKATGGNVEETVARYIAGPSGKGRGRDTRAYVKRVTNAYNQLGGATGTAGAGTAGAGGAPTDVGPAPQEAVPELPPAPVAPEAPKFGDRVRSARLQMAYNLMKGGTSAGIDEVALNDITDQDFQAGMKEDYDSRVQREADIVARQNTGYQADLNRYNTQSTNVQEQQYAERNAALAGNRAAGAAQRQNQFNADEAQKERDARLSEAQVRAEATKIGKAAMPPAMQKEYYAKASLINQFQYAKDIVKQHADSFGLQNKLPNDWLIRSDPGGVKARAALDNLASLVLQARSGAAVTPEEYARLTSVLALKADTPAAIGNKIDSMMDILRVSTNTMDKMWPDNPYAAALGAGNATTATMGNGSKPTVSNWND